jgi:malonyl-CoA/methylmalonyl-CoA synthetase
MLPKFDSKAIWENFLNTNVSQEEKPTIFMGVPTMYSKLLSHYDSAYGDNERKREFVKANVSSNIRYFFV